MNPRSAASAYTQTAFESAPPLKIIHMLYEGALRFLDQAEGVDPSANPAEFGTLLRRADAIVSELRISLDHDHAPELSENLSNLYLFVEGRIREAVLESTSEPLPAARDVLETLLAGWKELEV